MAWHASLAASRTKEWVNCPGVIALDEYYPIEQVSGKPAMLGTCAHALAERCLIEGVLPTKYKNRTIELLNPNTPNEGVSILKVGAKIKENTGRVLFTIDDNMCDAVGIYCTYINTRLGKLFPKIFEKIAPEQRSKLALEKKFLRLEVRTNPLPHRNDTGGTADAIIDAWPEVLEVIDYKHGSGVYVEPKDNPQVWSYLLGAAIETAFDYDAYRATVVQPRHYKVAEGGYSSQTVAAERLRGFQNLLKEASDKVDQGREVLKDLWHNCGVEYDPDPTLLDSIQALYKKGLISAKPDGSHCRWCRHILYCPAALAALDDAVAADFADEPTDIDHKIEGIAPELLSMILRWEGYVTNFFDKAREEAMARLSQGSSVPGFELVNKLGDRQWKADVNHKTVLSRLVTHYKVDPAKAMTAPVPAKLRTGVQVKNLVDKKLQEDFEAEFLHRPVGPPKLAPVKASSTALDDFNGV